MSALADHGFKCAALAGLAAGLLAAQSPALLVLAKSDHTLSIVNPATRRVVGAVPSGPDPHEVIASADGKMAYISNYGFGAYHTLTPVDLVKIKALPTIDLGALTGPHGLAFVGGHLWFTAEGAKAIGRYDPASAKVDWILGTGQDRTHMIYVFPDLSKIVTSNVSSATLSLIEKVTRPAGGGPPPGGHGGPPPGARRPPGGGGPPPGGGGPRTDWEETVIPVGKGAEGFDVSPDHKVIWAANAQDGTISIVDIASRKVVQTLNPDVHGANRLKFTPDGAHVLVSTLDGSDVVVFDASSRKVVQRVPVGHGAAGIVMQPDGALAYVACTPDDYVAIIDLKTLQVVGKISAGKQPDGLAWAARR